MYLIHASFDRVLTLSHGANLKLRQTNARAQTKVAQAHAQVCRGLATPLIDTFGDVMTSCHGDQHTVDQVIMIICDTSHHKVGMFAQLLWEHKWMLMCWFELEDKTALYDA